MKKSLLILGTVLLQVSICNCQTNIKESDVLRGPYLGQTPPENQSKIFAQGFISSEFGELNSVFTKDGKEFYFSRRGMPGKLSVVMVTRMTNDEWTNPEPVNLSGTNDDIDLFITPDGNSMIYCSGKVQQKDGRPYIDHDFWISKRDGEKWAEPILFAQEAMSKFEDYFPIVTQSGNLYLNSQRGGPGTNDLVFMHIEPGKSEYYQSIIKDVPGLSVFTKKMEKKQLIK